MSLNDVTRCVLKDDGTIASKITSIRLFYFVIGDYYLTYEISVDH